MQATGNDNRKLSYYLLLLFKKQAFDFCNVNSGQWASLQDELARATLNDDSNIMNGPIHHTCIESLVAEKGRRCRCHLALDSFDVEERRHYSSRIEVDVLDISPVEFRSSMLKLH